MTRFRAGCKRECDGPDDLAELAYTALAYPECPGCPHRVEPDGSGLAPASFCRWLPASTPNPFAALAGFREGLEP